MSVLRLYLPILLLLLATPVTAHEGIPATTIADRPLDKLADSIYLIHGPQQFPSPETAGFMNNPGFLVTSKGVVVIDPGSSVQIGRELVERIATITPQPVIAVFNTHVHGDHWLGNQAIREAYPDSHIYAHTRMIERLQRGEGAAWIRLLDEMTDGRTRGTEEVIPETGLHGGERLRFGDTTLQIHHTGKAHTDNDIMIEVEGERAIFLGDVVTNRRVQSARPDEGSLSGQLRAIDFVLQRDIQLFIPGHGLSGGRELLLTQRRFLSELDASMRRHYLAGLADYEMREPIMKELEAYRGWHNFEELGRVINAHYRQIEAELF